MRHFNGPLFSDQIETTTMQLHLVQTQLKTHTLLGILAQTRTPMGTALPMISASGNSGYPWRRPHKFAEAWKPEHVQLVSTLKHIQPWDEPSTVQHPLSAPLALSGWKAGIEAASLPAAPQFVVQPLGQMPDRSTPQFVSRPLEPMLGMHALYK